MNKENAWRTGLPSATRLHCVISHCHASDVLWRRSDGTGFLKKQPADHAERWTLPFDNGTHLVVEWRASSSVCGRNVSSYHVNVKTSLPVLNMFVGAFGSFPQDLCAAGGSKARDAVSVTEEEGAKGTCAVYERLCSLATRRTTFEIPTALVQVTKWDVEVTVMGYGSHAPPGKPLASVPVTWWCHKYRRRKGGDAGAAGSDDGAEQSSWLQSATFVLLGVAMLALPKLRGTVGALLRESSEVSAPPGAEEEKLKEIQGHMDLLLNQKSD